MAAAIPGRLPLESSSLALANGFTPSRLRPHDWLEAQRYLVRRPTYENLDMDCRGSIFWLQIFQQQEWIE